jgi:hypothetical protein
VKEETIKESEVKITAESDYIPSNTFTKSAGRGQEQQVIPKRNKKPGKRREHLSHHARRVRLRHYKLAIRCTGKSVRKYKNSNIVLFLINTSDSVAGAILQTGRETATFCCKNPANKNPGCLGLTGIFFQGGDGFGLFHYLTWCTKSVLFFYIPGPGLHLMLRQGVETRASTPETAPLSPGGRAYLVI